MADRPREYIRPDIIALGVVICIGIVYHTLAFFGITTAAMAWIRIPVRILASASSVAVAVWILWRVYMGLTSAFETMIPFLLAVLLQIVDALLRPIPIQMTRLPHPALYIPKFESLASTTA